MRGALAKSLVASSVATTWGRNWMFCAWARLWMAMWSETGQKRSIQILVEKLCLPKKKNSKSLKIPGNQHSNMFKPGNPHSKSSASAVKFSHRHATDPRRRRPRLGAGHSARSPGAARRVRPGPGGGSGLRRGCSVMRWINGVK